MPRVCMHRTKVGGANLARFANAAEGSRWPPSGAGPPPTAERSVNCGPPVMGAEGRT